MSAKTHPPTPLDPGEQLCGIGEAARYLAVSRSKLYSMMDAGELEYVKIGRSRRIRVAALLALINSHRVGDR